MLKVYCSGHGTWVLLDVSRVEAIRNTPDGPVADWHCWCGTKGSLLRGVQPVDRPGPSSARRLRSPIRSGRGSPSTRTAVSAITNTPLAVHRFPGNSPLAIGELFW